MSPMLHSLHQKACMAARVARRAYGAGQVYDGWHYRNACGTLSYSNGTLWVGVAGTNDCTDKLQDMDYRARSAMEWSSITGIGLAADARSAHQKVWASSGFLSHTAMAYRGIVDKADELGINWDEVAEINLCGHSLGGAACFGLQLTERFRGARAFVFGSPKFFHRKSHVPVRWRMTTWQWQDVITYGPPGFRHPEAQRLILTYPGAIPDTTVTKRLAPLVGAFVAIVWTRRLLRWSRRFIGLRGGELFQAHSMDRYYQLLGCELRKEIE